MIATWAPSIEGWAVEEHGGIVLVASAGTAVKVG
jgi:hypothetical protein